MGALEHWAWTVEKETEDSEELWWGHQQLDQHWEYNEHQAPFALLCHEQNEHQSLYVLFAHKKTGLIAMWRAA